MDFTSKKRYELEQLCRENKIKKFTGLKKAELIELINLNIDKIQTTQEEIQPNQEEIQTVRDLIHMLYDITILSSGMSLEDPVTFSNRMMKLINIGLGVDNDEDEEIGIDNIDETSSTEIADESTMEEVD